MGVTGAGKSTVGQALAASLGWPFYDGDDFHPAANVAKLKRGLPLDDADRAPWLAALAALIAQTVADGDSAVLACSALKEAYRAQLVAAGGDPVVFVHLRGDPALLRARLVERRGHFMKAKMLESQIETLEPPAAALTLDVREPPPILVDRIRAALHL